MKSTSIPLVYPESIPGIRLLREEGAWKYIDLSEGLDDAGLQMMLRDMPANRELCFFEYQFEDRVGDSNGLYVMLQVYEGDCYYWKGNHGRSAPLERLSVAEAADFIKENVSQDDAFLYLVPSARRFETRPDFRWHKAPQRAQDGQGELLRHFLATLAYRFQRSVAGQTSEYGDFAAGKGVRTPREIVFHMRQVLGFTVSALTEKPRPELSELPWTREVDAFHGILALLDEVLLHRPPNENLYKKLLQGPLTDTQSHIGQLAMLRRLYGNPVAGMNFFKAEIRTGNTSADQI